MRQLQRKLAEEVTVFVHSQEALEEAIKRSEFVFSNFSRTDLNAISEDFFEDIFGEFFHAEVVGGDLEKETDIVEWLSDVTAIFPSRRTAREAVANNSVSINKEKITADYKLSKEDVILDKYIHIQFGKKKTFVVQVK